MFLSIFDIFKIGVGPSSSHTMGPMAAAARFRDLLAATALPQRRLRIACQLFGSLAYTGEGHGTFRAVLSGLLGMTPQTYDREAADSALEELAVSKAVRLANGTLVSIDPATAIIAERGKRLPAHPNGMTFVLEDEVGRPFASETYYSIGGGFVLTEAEMARGGDGLPEIDVPYPFGTASEMLEMGNASGLSIAVMKRANEEARQPGDLDARIMAVWDVMDRCIDRGLTGEGILPGGLNVKRRAHGLSEKLAARAGANDAPLHSAVDWLQAYAMAVNEENAAGGQVVTAPTNGAAG
ncbi:MAG: serine dehydratase beta chain, partial [Devosia sp.]